MNLKVVQEVVVPKVTAGILEIEGVMSNTKWGIIKYDTNRINANCNSSTNKI